MFRLNINDCLHLMSAQAGNRHHFDHRCNPIDFISTASIPLGMRSRNNSKPFYNKHLRRIRSRTDVPALRSLYQCGESKFTQRELRLNNTEITLKTRPKIFGFWRFRNERTPVPRRTRKTHHGANGLSFRFPMERPCSSRGRVFCSAPHSKESYDET
jgi:hypothetical protein